MRKNKKSDSAREDFRASLRDKRNTVLIDELYNRIEEMIENDFDETVVEDYLAVLRDKTSLDMSHLDAEESFKRFQEKYAPEFEAAIYNPPKRLSKKHLRTASAIAAAACLIFAIVFIPTDDYGNSFMNRIVHWGEEVLSFRGLPPGGIMTLPVNSDSEYRSIAEVLEKNGISSASCPTWIPAGFSLVEIEASKNDKAKVFVAFYRNGELQIHFLIHYNENSSAVLSVEKDPMSNLYISKGKEYNILTNMEVLTAVWSDDYSTYQIFGDISIDDLQIMIDSIKERR